MQLAMQSRKKNDPGIHMGTGVPMSGTYCKEDIEATSMQDTDVRRLLTVCEDNRTLKEAVEIARKDHRRIKVLLRITLLITVAGFAGGAAAGYMAYEKLNNSIAAVSSVDEMDFFYDRQLEAISQAVSDGLEAYEEAKQAQVQAEEEAAKKATQEAEQKAAKEKEQESKDNNESDESKTEEKESEESE